MSAVREKILEILSEIRPEADYVASSDYLSDGLLDSADIVSLVGSLDQSYSISIDGLDILPEHFRNAQTIASLLTKYGVDE